MSRHHRMPNPYMDTVRHFVLPTYLLLGVPALIGIVYRFWNSLHGQPFVWDRTAKGDVVIILLVGFVFLYYHVLMQQAYRDHHANVHSDNNQEMGKNG